MLIDYVYLLFLNKSIPHYSLRRLFDVHVLHAAQVHATLK